MRPPNSPGASRFSRFQRCEIAGTTYAVLRRHGSNQTQTRAVGENPMLRWIRNKLGTAFVLRDTEKTLRAVRRMPWAAQVDVARRISSVMAEVEVEMQRLPPWPNPEIEQLAARFVAQARQERQAAMTRGATDWSDPDWAKAALIESWALGLTGHLGESAFADLNVGLKPYQSFPRGWMRRHLRPEMRRGQRSGLGRLRATLAHHYAGETALGSVPPAGGRRRRHSS